jgi:hypothetical protein
MSKMLKIGDYYRGAIGRKETLGIVFELPPENTFITALKQMAPLKGSNNNKSKKLSNNPSLRSRRAKKKLKPKPKLKRKVSICGAFNY